MANHLSLFDIPVLYGWLKLELKCIIKKELRGVPLIGFACTAMGYIFIDRSPSSAGDKAAGAGYKNHKAYYRGASASKVAVVR